MTTKVTKKGVLVPKEYFRGVEQVRITKKKNGVLLEPLTDDPIFLLGTKPVRDGVTDASVNHDKYLYKT